MAGYREHISVSAMCGLGYGVAATLFAGFTPVQGALAGILTWVAGMLPDLDSDTGKPTREVFSLLGAIAPFAMMGHLLKWGGDAEGAMLLAILVYGGIRYGLSTLLARVSVHRGMFHSIPALVIAAEIAFLAYKSESVVVKLLMAGGVGLGFFSHLLLDEVYAVQWKGLTIRLNKAAGSALKLAGRSFIPNVVTYALLMLLSYAAMVDVGLIQGAGAEVPSEATLQQAAEPVPPLQ